MDILSRSEESRHEPMPPAEVSCHGLATTRDSQAVMACISHRDQPGQLLLWSVAAGRLASQEKTAVQEAYPEMRPIACQIGIREDDSLYGLAVLQPLSRGW